MKSPVTKKKKLPDKNFGQKFIDEQNYAEQEFHLVDPVNDTPDYTDEKGVAPAQETEDNIKDNEK